MQYSTNYNFNLPEGTDLWNYLTQTNPNFSNLDTILKGVQDLTITKATEVFSGTAHAITRTLPDCDVIRYTATSNWTLGDTMTIDGNPVTVVKPNGTNLQTGDYVIGSEVLGVLRSSQFTVYLGAPSSLDAANITYDNTVSGLTATDVQNAIDEEASAIDTINSNLTNILVQTVSTSNVIIPNRTAVSGNPFNLPLPTINRSVLNIYNSHDANFGQLIIEQNGTTVSSINIGVGDYVYITGIIK